MPEIPSPLDRQQLIAQLRDTAAKLGKRSLTREEFVRETGISRGRLRTFGTFSDCARAAGLQPCRAHAPLSDDDLLDALRDDVATMQGRISLKSFCEIGRYHIVTYRLRWGSWPGALAALARRLEWREPDFPYLEAVRAMARRRPAPASLAASRAASEHRPCGPPLDYRVLRHAPVNEQGVVFLFGALAYELGFIVESVAAAFPDCTAKRRVNSNRDLWTPVRIEFEHESRNFKAHGHDPQGCDLIVCWEHNWPDCPIEVIELKSAVAGAA